MFDKGIIHPELAAWIARLGHHDYLLITDAGFPYLAGIPRIDLGFTVGQPSFLSVVQIVMQSLVSERVWVTREFSAHNPRVYNEFEMLLLTTPLSYHENYDLFKAESRKASVVIRTGEFTPYANCLIECGVPFAPSLTAGGREE